MNARHAHSLPFAGVAVLAATLCSPACAADKAAPPPKAELKADGDAAEAHAVVAGGCFWCTEAVFEQVEGVKEVVSGYAGGSVINANYQDVSRGLTNHAEAIRITYDPRKVTYGKLLQIFFTMHDPTQKDRQGPDVGRQYRSTVFYADDREKRFAEDYVKQLNAAAAFGRPVATTVEPLRGFFPAEDDHQDYVVKHPRDAYVVQNALPKIPKFRKLFPQEAKKTR